MKQCLFCSGLLVGVISVLLPIVTSYFVCQMAMKSQMYREMSNTTLERGLVQPDEHSGAVAGTYLRRLQYHRDPLTDLNFRFEEVEFPSNDEPHHKLRGWFIPALRVRMCWFGLSQSLIAFSPCVCVCVCVCYVCHLLTGTLLISLYNCCVLHVLCVSVVCTCVCTDMLLISTSMLCVWVFISIAIMQTWQPL